MLETFIEEWRAAVPRERILRLDVTRETPDFSQCVPIILARIHSP
jgi:FMN-dependent NADH-azoreductase